MLLSVLREILEYKYRAPKLLISESATPFKVALVVASLVISLTQPLTLVLLYVTTLLLGLLVLGLWRTVVYIVLSTLTLYASMVLGALIFRGGIMGVTRFTLIAASTLPALLFLFTSTPPSATRRIPVLYLLLIVFNSVLREVLDIACVFKARGSEGYKYWLRVMIASIILSYVRSTALIESLRSRGVEVE